MFCSWKETTHAWQEALELLSSEHVCLASGAIGEGIYGCESHWNSFASLSVQDVRVEFYIRVMEQKRQKHIEQLWGILETRESKKALTKSSSEANSNVQ